MPDDKQKAKAQSVATGKMSADSLGDTVPTNTGVDWPKLLGITSSVVGGGALTGAAAIGAKKAAEEIGYQRTGRQVIEQSVARRTVTGTRTQAKPATPPIFAVTENQKKYQQLQRDRQMRQAGQALQESTKRLRTAILNPKAEKIGNAALRSAASQMFGIKPESIKDSDLERANDILENKNHADRNLINRIKKDSPGWGIVDKPVQIPAETKEKLLRPVNQQIQQVVTKGNEGSVKVTNPRPLRSVVRDVGRVAQATGQLRAAAPNTPSSKLPTPARELVQTKGGKTPQPLFSPVTPEQLRRRMIGGVVGSIGAGVAGYIANQAWSKAEQNRIAKEQSDLKKIEGGKSGASSRSIPAYDPERRSNIERTLDMDVERRWTSLTPEQRLAMLKGTVARGQGTLADITYFKNKYAAWLK